MMPLNALFNRRNRLAWLILLASLLLTLLSWHGLNVQSRDSARQQFELQVRDVVDATRERLRQHEQILLGGAGLFDASGEVTRENWRNYVKRLNLSANYPGIQGVGFSQVVLPRQLPAHVGAIRAQGFPQYSVRPAGEREVYTSIIYLEPFTGRNLAAFGFDMMAEATRAQAMRRAAHTGQTAITGKVKLVQETHGKQQAGFLMYVPVYRALLDPGSPEARWAALAGFVYSPYRMSDLMRGVLGERALAVDFVIHDGDTATEETVMYTSTDDHPRAGPHAEPLMRTQRALEAYGRTWTVRFDSRPELEGGADTVLHRVVLLLGCGISGLLFLMVSGLTARRAQAEEIAAQMTAEIRENEEQLRLSERQAQESAQFLQSIMDNAVDGIITIDEQGMVQSFNRAAEGIFGHAASAVLGRNVNMLMPEPYRSQHDGYLKNYRDTGVKRIIGIGREVEGLRRDGSVFPLDLAVSRSEHGGQPLYIGLVRDITERKRVEKMKAEFISTVSHELRTPLTSIRGALGLLSGGAVGELPAQVNAMLKIASNNTERLLLLINDILDMQKIESGQLTLRFQSLEVTPFLHQVLHDLAGYGEQHRVRFVLAREAAGVQVYADKDRLTQVMANLLSNAAKFSPRGGQVEVAVDQLPTGLRISVTDHGPGIPPEFHAKLFERFTQADSSDTRSRGGTGLGLAITKAIVEKHGGQIGFVTQVGAGTTFYVDLPLLVSAPVSTPAAAPVAAADHSRVLVVEDDPDVAALIKRMLAEAGFPTDIAHDAAQARALLAKNRNAYALMTLDIMLPGEDGISLFRSLRAEAATHDLPVVVLSVKVDEARQEISGGAVGVLDWLAKPIDQQRLVAVVRRAAKPGRLPRVLHVEDDPDILAVVGAMLHGHCELASTSTVAASRAALQQQEFDLVLLDVGLPDGSGLDLLDTIEHRVRPPKVVVFSARDVPPSAVGRVGAVLVKSRTSNEELMRVLRESMVRD
jgi:PAS domain S-box-containing protein